MSTRDYLNAITERIKWKRARRIVEEELQAHIEDEKESLIKAGIEEGVAEQQAVKEMGDPVEVGDELNQLHRPKRQLGLLLLTVGLAITGGLLRVWLTAEWTEQYMAYSPVKTLAAITLGIIALLAMYFLDSSFLMRHAKKIYAAIFIISLFSLQFSPKIGYVSYWTRYITLTFPVIYALWVWSCRGGGFANLFLAIIGIAPLIAICAFTPYLMSLFVLLLTAVIIMLVAAQADWWGLGRIISTILILPAYAIYIVLLFSALLECRRFDIALHPETDPEGMGYIGIQIHNALSSVHWIGAGTWRGVFPYEQTIPACDTDFFLTTIIFKLGWLPFILLTLAAGILLLCMSIRLSRQKNVLARLLALSLVCSFGIQIFFSIAANLGFVFFMPHFPLIIGNSHMILDMALIGLVLGIFRNETVIQESRKYTPDNHFPTVWSSKFHRIVDILLDMEQEREI